MKNMRISGMVLLCLLLTACFFRKNEAYTFPADFTKEQKEKTAALCDKGKVVYDLNCAKCHNTIVNGKPVIPDFTVAKLEAYKLLIFPEHQANLSPSKISPEELINVTAFLMYKKKNKPQKK